MPPPAEPRTLTARWVFPAAGPPLAGGAVTVRGDRVEAVEPHGARAPDEDLGNVAVIPGLVNAHTHLDLTGARGRTPPTDAAHFTDWLGSVIAYRRGRPPEAVQEDIRVGLAECLRHGTTLVGDIAADGASWDPVAAAPVRAVVFREFLGFSRQRAEQAADQAAEWHRSHAGTPTCRAGQSPHAPYSVHGSYLTGFTRGLPFAVHLAESPAELRLLTDRDGPFVGFLRELGIWDPANLVPSIDRVLASSRHADHVLFAHCNYLPVEKCRYIAGLHAVVYCPRTHAAFGHPPHPFREFLARGVRVCLGTDGLSSNPDLDVLAEARFVRGRYPDFPGDTLLKMVTLSGAEALGWADEAGSLGPGKSADLVAVPLPARDAADPHDLLFAPDAPAGGRRTMFRGEWRD